MLKRDTTNNKIELIIAGKISKKILDLKKMLKNKKKIEEYLLREKNKLQKKFNINIEYLELRNKKTLLRSKKSKDSKIFIAYYLKDVRLIDNF